MKTPKTLVCRRCGATKKRKYFPADRFRLHMPEVRFDVEGVCRWCFTFYEMKAFDLEAFIKGTHAIGVRMGETLNRIVKTFLKNKGMPSEKIQVKFEPIDP